MAAKKKMASKVLQMKKPEVEDAKKDTDLTKNIFDHLLLKAKKINEKYDISRSENSSLLTPKR
jgi:hypothetical protein